MTIKEPNEPYWDHSDMLEQETSARFEPGTLAWEAGALPTELLRLHKF